MSDGSLYASVNITRTERELRDLYDANVSTFSLYWI